MNIPIACSLGSNELAKRIAELERALFSQSESLEQLPDGLRHRFAATPDVKRRLFAFIEHETACCAVLTFGLTFAPDHGPIWLSITGPADALPLIEETFAGR